MNYSVLDSIKTQDENTLREQFAIDVLIGLTAKEKNIPSKYFYNDEGSRLFSKITEQEEYYLTQSEFDVFYQHSDAILDLFSRKGVKHLIEFGAGDGKKSKVFLKKLLKKEYDLQYFPNDISELAVKKLSEELTQSPFESLKYHGIVGEYFPSLKWWEKNYEGRKAVFLLGSTIGNFTRSETLQFLKTLWNHLNQNDYLFLGFDLKKNIDRLLWAYNDRAGVTKSFNLNLLTRINNELGGDFDLEQFEHFGTYIPQRGAMASYLIAKKDQKVRIEYLNKTFSFKAFEPIHLEYSYKYLPSEIEHLAQEIGFEQESVYYDSRAYYANALWKVEKGQR